MKKYFSFAILILLLSSVFNSRTSKFEIDIDFDERSQNLPQTIASFEAIKALAEKSNNPIELKEYQKLVEDLKKADTVFSIFNMKYKIPKDPETPSQINFDCYRYMINSYKSNCFNNLKEFDLPYMKYFAFSCKDNNKEEMADFLKGVCNVAKGNKF